MQNSVPMAPTPSRKPLFRLPKFSFKKKNPLENNLLKDSSNTSLTPKKNKKWLSVLLTVFSVLLILTTITATLAFFFGYVPAKKIYSQTLQAQDKVNELKIAISDKDLNLSKVKLQELKESLNQIEASYNKVSYAKALPYLKDYYKDGSLLISIGYDAIDTGNILITSVEPYQDFLGLKGSATDAEQSTQDRITFLTESIEGIVPNLDSIEEKIASIETKLQQIDPQRYPEYYKDIPLRSTILQSQSLISEAHKLVKDGKPILTKTSWLLGKDEPRNYFLMFQNDAELRPTGGFWTAYGTITVNNGKITPGVSSNIYDLDARFNSTIPAPRPIKAYHINVPYLNLRDLNVSPDFPTAIEEFLGYYQKMYPKEKIDAVIALDTNVLVDLVEVLGRIGVPAYGNFSSEPDKRCDGCPQIIYQLEWIAGRPRDYIETDRKGFLGPLMNSILSNAMGSGKDKLGPLAQAGFKNVYQKHVLFYFTDPEMQEAAELANIAGKISQTEASVDYFHLNDANMSAAKTNLFLQQKIKHEIIVKDEKVNHKVTVTYINPSKASNCNLEKGDLCLNAPKYRNWFRFYVPQGSQMVKMTGSEVEPVLYEELGKQVFEGFYGNKYPLYAQSSLKTSVQYTSSVAPSSDYQLLLQKQPGTKGVDYQLWVNGNLHEEFEWLADKTIKLSLK